MIHIASSKDALTSPTLTACGLTVTATTDIWGHYMTLGCREAHRSPEPLTTFPAQVNCKICKSEMEHGLYITEISPDACFMEYVPFVAKDFELDLYDPHERRIAGMLATITPGTMVREGFDTEGSGGPQTMLDLARRHLDGLMSDSCDLNSPPCGNDNHHPMTLSEGFDWAVRDLVYFDFNPVEGPYSKTPDDKRKFVDCLLRVALTPEFGLTATCGQYGHAYQVDEKGLYAAPLNKDGVPQTWDMQADNSEWGDVEWHNLDDVDVRTLEEFVRILGLFRILKDAGLYLVAYIAVGNYDEPIVNGAYVELVSKL